MLLCKAQLSDCLLFLTLLILNTFFSTTHTEVQESGNRSAIPEEVDTCTLNPCRHGGECRPDDELGYRCMCPLGRTGVICRQRE